MRTAPAAVWHRAKLEAGKPAQEAMQWQGGGEKGAQWVAVQVAGSAGSQQNCLMRHV